MSKLVKADLFVSLKFSFVCISETTGEVSSKPAAVQVLQKSSGNCETCFICFDLVYFEVVAVCIVCGLKDFTVIQ